jgi:hypothetical protein
MKKFAIILLAAAISVSLMLGACASQTEYSESVAVAPDKAYEGDVAVVEEAMPTVEMEEAAGASDEWGLGNLDNAVLPETGRKLVYSSDFTISTPDFEEDYGKILDACERYDGYVQSESTSGQPPTTENSSGRSSYFELRIPVDHYEAFVGEVSAVGELQSKNLYTQDISSNYYDNESRIEVLEEERARLMEHLRNATEMEDVIALESQLSDVLYQLDQLKGAQRGMDNQVDYATVTVSLYETTVASNLQNSEGTVGERAANAFSLSLIGVGNFFSEFAVFMAGAFPVIVVILIFLAAAFAIVFGIRAANRKIKTRNKK